MLANKTFYSKPLAAALACCSTMAFSAGAQEISYSYGIDFASNYISKGLTQTDDGFAVQPYFDLSFGDFYVGTWWSNASFDDDPDIEFDLYAGWAPTFGQTSLDIGFAQYLYRDDSADYGEAYLKVYHDFSGVMELGFEYYYEVYSDFDWYELLAQAPLPNDWSVFLTAGTDFGSQDWDDDLVEYQFGVSRDLTDNVAIDLRVNDSSEEGTRGIVMLSLFN